jgi:hypothetical protein
MQSHPDEGSIHAESSWCGQVQCPQNLEVKNVESKKRRQIQCRMGQMVEGKNVEWNKTSKGITWTWK